MIKNGRIVDGSGNPWFRADLGIQDGKIEVVDNLSGAEAKRIIDAKDFVVTPGFVDIHSHSDLAMLVNSNVESKVRQGVTLEVNGNCGNSPAPLRGIALEKTRSRAEPYGLKVDWTTLGEYLELLEKQGSAVNSVCFVGHNTVRRCVLGDEERLVNNDELGEMKVLVAQGMEDGAPGLSTGLEFVPGKFSNTEELVELCRVVARYGGIYVTHQRQRDILYEEATEEAIEIGMKTGLPVHLSHFTVRYPAEGKEPALLWMVEDARKKGLDITFDVVAPNDAPSHLLVTMRDGYHWPPTNLAHQMIPPWGLKGGIEKTLEMCRDPEIRKRFRAEQVPQFKLLGIPKGLYPEYPEGLPPRWDRIVLRQSEAFQEYTGMTFEEIGEAMGKDPWDAAIDILVAHGEKTGRLDVVALAASTNAKDMIAAMKHPLASIESDRSFHAPYGPLSLKRAPPNSYGAFPRVFRKYVRERGYLTLEDAVRKMTSAPCLVLGLRDRGMIREGMWADVVVFNPDRIQDRATLEEPTQYPIGIDYVLVNGEIVIENGEHTGALPGKVLRRKTNTD